MAKIILTHDQLHKIQQLEVEVLGEVERICKKHKIKYVLGYGTLLGAIRHQGFIPWDDDIDICLLREDYDRFKEICKTELSSKYFYQCQETDPEYFHLFDKIRVNDTIFKEDLLAHHNIHHGVYIDIFPFDYIPDSKLKRILQFIKFHYYRTGLMTKYISIEERRGIKLSIAKILRVFYRGYSLELLYSKANKEAQKYNKEDQTYIYNFCSAVNENALLNADCLKDVIYTKFENCYFLIPRSYEDVLKVKYGNYMELPPEKDRIPHHHLTELKL